jgi:transaldolase
MKATKLLHNLGQSIWLDNITRELLNTGTLQKYIDELSVTGLTSNPTIFDHAIKKSTSYDSAIREKLAQGKLGEALFFELALEDLTRAADIFRPIHDRSNGVDGWVSQGDCEEVLAQFGKAGVDVDALAAKLQDEGAKSFVKSWNDLISVIMSKSDVLKKAAGN